MVLNTSSINPFIRLNFQIWYHFKKFFYHVASTYYLGLILYLRAWPIMLSLFPHAFNSYEWTLYANYLCIRQVVHLNFLNLEHQNFTINHVKHFLLHLYYTHVWDNPKLFIPFMSLNDFTYTSWFDPSNVKNWHARYPNGSSIHKNIYFSCNLKMFCLQPEKI